MISQQHLGNFWLPKLQLSEMKQRWREKHIETANGNQCESLKHIEIEWFIDAYNCTTHMVTAPPSEANSAEAIFTSDGKIEVNKLSALSRLSDGIVGIRWLLPWFELIWCFAMMAVWLLWNHEMLCRMRLTSWDKITRFPPKSDTDVTTMSFDWDKSIYYHRFLVFPCFDLRSFSVILTNWPACFFDSCFGLEPASEGLDIVTSTIRRGLLRQSQTRRVWMAVVEHSDVSVWDKMVLKSFQALLPCCSVVV